MMKESIELTRKLNEITEREERLEAIRARRIISLKSDVRHAFCKASIPECGAVLDLVYSDIDWLLAEAARLTKIIEEQDRELRFLRAINEGDFCTAIKIKGHVGWLKPGQRVRKQYTTMEGFVVAIVCSDKFTDPKWWPQPFAVVKWDEYSIEFDKSRWENRSKYEVALDELIIIDDRRKIKKRRTGTDRRS